MLGIIGLIFKIFAIMLLSILIFVFGLICLVLFVPIRYRADMAYREKKAKGIVCISWLLHFLHIVIRFGESGLEFTIRIAGIALGKKDKNNTTGKKKRKNTKKAKKKTKHSRKKKDDGQTENIEAEADDSIEQEIEEVMPDSQKETKLTVEEQQQAGDRELLEKIQDKMQEDSATCEPSKENGRIITEEDRNQGKDEQKKDAFSVRIRNKIAALQKKFIDFLQGFFRKLQNLEEKKLWICSLWEELNGEAMKPSVRRLKKNLKKIGKHLFAIKGDIVCEIGFEDPSKTGNFLAILAILYPMFSGHLSVTPYFDRAILEGSIKIKGRIRLSVFVFAGIDLWRDKKLRRFVNKVKNGGRSNGKGRK